ncbi:hypothetical protein [Mycetohabitans rhizoxinica]|uniref:Uncharacterized protein n=1 Tax=Mycetohabitans rhizoxinica TaxID=412963 RepID=A0ABZ2Q059_9BURK
MSILRNASVKFITPANSDDKDADTHVTVTVRDSNNRIAARIDSDFGHFSDHSVNGPYGLIIRNRSSAEELEAGNVTIRIDPNGHDTWIFNFDLDLQFDGDEHYGATYNNIVLNQDNRETSFGLQGVLEERH